MPLSLASAINLNMAVFVFSVVFEPEDTEGDVGLRADFGRKRTLDGARCVGTLRSTPLPRFRSFALTNE